MLLYRHAAICFALLTAFVFVGFWPTYFSVLSEQQTGYAHAHGLSMLAWCAMLITQAWLIRTKRRPLHRDIGKLSYALVPIIVVGTLGFAHFNLVRDGFVPARLYVLFIQLQLLLLFVVAYAMAIRHRKQPAVHARYMICTSLTLIDPIFFRVIFNAGWQPSDPSLLQLVTFPLTDLVLLALIATTWRETHRPRVFPLMLVAFVIMQVLNFVLPDTAFWMAFARWYVTLPF